MRKQYVVTLPEETGADLHTLISSGTAPARVTAHARILLTANQGEAGPGWTDAMIAAAVEVHWTTVARVRQTYVTEGLDAARYRQPPDRVSPRQVDGEQAAQLIALTCGSPPEGRARWSLRLLARALVRLEVVDTVSPETVRQVLKQTNGSPGGSSRGASRRPPTLTSCGIWRISWRSTLGPTTRSAPRSAWMRPAANCWAR